MGLSNILFAALLIGGSAFFAFNIRKVIANIRLGKAVNRTDSKVKRIKTMARVALGQSRMTRRPIAGVLHVFIYLAFIITQIELIEIAFDGITGSHRAFMEFLGGFYTFMISMIEVLSFLALIATLAFLSRRNLLKLPRFHKSEMTGWPKLDGNIILYMEFVLVMCIFTMNGTDEALRLAGESHASGSGSFGFAISSF